MPAGSTHWRNASAESRAAGDRTMTKAQETPTRKPSREQPPPRPRGGPVRRVAQLGLAGADAARRRGSVLRRLLATGDWLTLVATLCIVTAASPQTDVGTLFWATMFSPVWILVLKLHGLYDNDHRRIRHSTLDEISSLISAAALGTLALDGLLALSPVGPLAAPSAIAVGLGALAGSFASRAVLRFFWHRLAGTATGLVIGPAGGGRRGRAARRHPPRDPPAPGRLPGAARRGRRRGRHVALPRHDLRTRAGRRRGGRRAGDRHRAADERAGGGAADRAVQGGRAGADLPPPALRPARPGDRAQPAGRAAGARLPLLRPAALDRGDEADDGPDDQQRDARPALPRARAQRAG